MSRKRQTEMKLLKYEARIYRENIRQDLGFLHQKTAMAVPWAGATGLAILVFRLFRRDKTESTSLWSLRGASSILWLVRRYLESRAPKS